MFSKIGSWSNCRRNIKSNHERRLNSISAIGAVDNTGGTGQGLKVPFEGEHGTDTYDGSNSETLAAHLEDVVQALGTVDGVNLASAAITAFEL